MPYRIATHPHETVATESPLKSERSSVALNCLVVFAAKHFLASSWTHLQCRCSVNKPGSLEFLVDHSLDIVNASRLFDSPFLHTLASKCKQPLDVYQSVGRELKENLLKQLEWVLKPGSVFMYNDPGWE